jgi:hypothetical protein
MDRRWVSIPNHSGNGANLTIEVAAGKPYDPSKYQPEAAASTINAPRKAV